MTHSPSVLETRPIVQLLATVIEERLQANDHKTGWDTLPLSSLVMRLQDEVTELRRAPSHADMLHEAGDVGAHLAFIVSHLTREPCSKCHGTGTYRVHQSCRGADCPCGPCPRCDGAGREPVPTQDRGALKIEKTLLHDALVNLAPSQFLRLVYGVAHERGIILNGAPLGVPPAKATGSV